MTAASPSGIDTLPLPPWLTEWITLAAVSLFLALAVQLFFLQGNQSSEKGSSVIGEGQTLGVRKCSQSSEGVGEDVQPSLRSSKEILSELRATQTGTPSSSSPVPSDAAECSTAVTDISTTEEWNQTLLQSSKKSRPVVAKFTATWCKPCHAIDPFFVSLAADYNGIFVRVDVDDFDEIAADCSVSGMPTFVVLLGKEIVGSVSGTDSHALEDLCMKHCSSLKSKQKQNKVEPDNAELSRAIVNEERAMPTSTEGHVSIADDALLDHRQSSTEHPGLDCFHEWHAAVSGRYRSYSIATSSEISPKIPTTKRTRSPLRVLVTNATSGPLEAWKLDQGGSEILMGSIGSGRTLRESGALGQPWAFKEKGKEHALMIFVPHQALPGKDDSIGVYKFHILPPGLKAKQEGRVCDISDPVFPFPSTKISSVSKAVGWSIQQMEREWLEAASKTSYYRAPRTVLKYIRNVLKAPSELKYRRIRMENGVFQSDCWHSAGKGVLLALGFEELGGFVEMGGPKPLTSERLEQLADAAAQLDAFVRGKARAPVAREEQRMSVPDGIQNLFSSLEDGKLLQNGAVGAQERISLGDALAGKEFILLYASAHWCPPCRRFTPQLIQFYNMTKHADTESIEVVFLSADREIESFQSYFATMPWFAVPFGSAEVIKNYIQVQGIPRLCVIDGRTGRILEANVVGMPFDIERWRALRDSS